MHPFIFMADSDRVKRVKKICYALPHKGERMDEFAKMLGYSTSALLNLAFDKLYEAKKEEFLKWVAEQNG